jgi:mRNA interferase YafQ
MMKTLRYSTQYKKDFKRYRNDPAKLAKLLEVFRMLENEIELPEGYKAHMLKGEYKGCMECHIEGDFLLIWIDGDIINVLRIGSHSELFGKKK